MITKPMSVLRQEFIDKMIDDINGSQLPLFVVEPILQDILSSVKNSVHQQYMTEKAQYEQQLAAMANNEQPKVE